MGTEAAQAVLGVPECREAWIDVGRVSRVHGLRGALTVVLYGNDPSNLAKAARLCLERGGSRREFEIAEARPAGPSSGRAKLRLRLTGLDTREDAEPWAGASVLIPETALPPLPEGEYYWRDLIGLRCVSVGGRQLGVVEEIWETGSNDVLVVRDGKRMLLIPALYDVLVAIDRAAGELRVDPPEELLEDQS